MLFYGAILFYQNYSAYQSIGQVVATSGRYFLPVIPIFLAFIALALVKMSGRYKNALLVPLVLIMILFTQGGGMATFLLNVKREIYWDNSIVLRVNDEGKNLAKKIIVEDKYKFSPF